MSLLADDPMTQLAFSVYESKGVFALLLGSGLSRTAQIPTGWEITLDLIRRVALAQGVAEQADWAAWYREKTGQEPDYSALLKELAASPEERRSILHGYIEPTEDDREEGRKVPTAAHHAIAALARGGYVRVIITTNFDRLIENALREQGIEPTIVGSVDALRGAEPITHSICYLLKLHGDYKDARILNTETELNKYPPKYNRLLDRILDEHGLIVCGWSGEWDHALRAAFLRAPNRRYSIFWAARGDVASGANDLIAHRGARVIPIADADSFFSTLRQSVETLEQSRQPAPQSVELLVNGAKRFLAKAEHRIQLDELVAREANRVLVQLDDPIFNPQGSWDRQSFRLRVRRYESIMEGLANVAGVLGRWGDGSELPLVLDAIRSLYLHAEKLSSGLDVFVKLRSYPAVLVLTGYGLGLTRAERWGILNSFFNAEITPQYGQNTTLVRLLFLWAWSGSDREAWQPSDGPKKLKTPLSDHLYALFANWGKTFVGLVPDFELIFERYEMIGSLAYLAHGDKGDLQSELNSSDQRRSVWMPMGRAGWHRDNAERLIAEFQAEPKRAAMLRGGLGKGDPEFIELFIKNFSRIAERMRW